MAIESYFCPTSYDLINALKTKYFFLDKNLFYFVLVAGIIGVGFAIWGVYNAKRKGNN